MPKTSINISDTSLSWENLDQSVKKAHAALSGAQQQEGYWVYELEADATIPAEYILLEHFIDQINDPLEQKMAVYLRRIHAVCYCVSADLRCQSDDRRTDRFCGQRTASFLWYFHDRHL